MLFGLLPPYRSGVTADPEWVVPFVVQAEALGFESFYSVEHVVVPVGHAAASPYTETVPIPLPSSCPTPDPPDPPALPSRPTPPPGPGHAVRVDPHHPTPRLPQPTPPTPP